MNKSIIKISLLCIIVIGLLWYWLQGDTNSDVIDTLPEREISEAGPTIVAFGDSLTAGYGLPESEAYPAQLEAALIASGYAVRVINSGVSGETTRGNLERAKFIRKQSPDIVLLGIGGNDALRLLPLEDTKRNMTETVRILQAGEKPPIVILLRMQAPLTSGLGYKREFDAFYEDLAAEYKLALVPFLTAEVFLDNNYKLQDGIHLNQAGYKKVVDDYLMPTLTKVLKKFED